jgi:(p)ppGpp synthase/HD superfamily hydrolase
VSAGPFGPEFSRALAYAGRVHAGDRRKGTEIPYLAHLLAVAVLVVEEGGDETQSVAALLHDTAEDHGGRARLDEIEREFGADVTRIVAALSDSLAPEGVPKAPWHERKEAYLAHLRAERDPAILRVANADKVHNARSILGDLHQEGPRVWDRFQTRSADDQLWYYRELSDAFAASRPGAPLALELAAIVEALERAQPTMHDSGGRPKST